MKISECLSNKISGLDSDDFDCEYGRTAPNCEDCVCNYYITGGTIDPRTGKIFKNIKKLKCEYVRSQMNDYRTYIECDCGSDDHLLVVRTTDGFENDLYMAEIGFISNFRLKFFKRLIYGLKYIFLKRDYYISDTVCFSDRNINQLQKLADCFKKQVDKVVNDNI